MSTADKTQIAKLDELHRDMERLGLRGLWQRYASEPTPRARPLIWRWSEIAPVLEHCSRVVRLPEDTDQRVVGLTMPGQDWLNATVSLGFQMLNPGEVVPSHRHTATQMRFVIQGSGSYTISDGEELPMEPGDLLIQSNWTWHGTIHAGNEPAVWLDFQDRNFVNYAGAFRRQQWAEGDLQPVTKPRGYYHGLWGTVRPKAPSDNDAPLPPFRYSWAEAMSQLEEMEAAGEYDAQQGLLLEYANPVTGAHTVPTMSVQLLMLRPGESTRPRRQTGSTSYHVISGQGVSTVEGDDLAWDQRDSFAIPPLQWHHHRNRSSNKQAILLVISARPALEALDLYFEESR